MEENNKLAQAGFFDDGKKPVFWKGWFNCFSSVVNMFGAQLADEQEGEWEVRWEALSGLRFVGAGAQGEVFEARLRGEPVAVKRVRHEADADVRHLRRLRHPNIVRFLGACAEPPHLCVVMEYCEGGSLFEALRAGQPASGRLLARWTVELARGMTYLHAHRIIHRDLKSPNVLLGAGMALKVSDFGASRRSDDASTVMSFAGTVAWMAPEVIRHEPCSARVDVWSFGVVVWEMATRLAPYGRLEAAAVLWGVGAASLSLPLPASLPAPLRLLLERAWRRAPRDRPSFAALEPLVALVAAELRAIDDGDFAARSALWTRDAERAAEAIFARSPAAPSARPSEAPAPEGSAGRSARAAAAWARRLRRANELYLEVCAVRLQLEQREAALRRREEAARACACGRSRGARPARRRSTSSSGGLRAHVDRNATATAGKATVVERDGDVALRSAARRVPDADPV